MKKSIISIFLLTVCLLIWNTTAAASVDASRSSRGPEGVGPSDVSRAGSMGAIRVPSSTRPCSCLSARSARPWRTPPPRPHSFRPSRTGGSMEVPLVGTRVAVTPAGVRGSRRTVEVVAG